MLTLEDEETNNVAVDPSFTTMFDYLYPDAKNGVHDMILSLYKNGKLEFPTGLSQFIVRDEIYDLKFFPISSSTGRVNAACLYTDIEDESGHVTRKIYYICGGSYTMGDNGYYDADGDGQTDWGTWIDNAMLGIERDGSLEQGESLAAFNATIDALHLRGVLDGVDDFEVIVSGHSKGGNIAKYITLFSNQVDLCISFDGVGFSDDFVQAHSFEIASNASKIINVNPEVSYVGSLFNELDGSSNVYIDTTYFDIDISYIIGLIGLPKTTESMSEEEKRDIEREREARLQPLIAYHVPTSMLDSLQMMKPTCQETTLSQLVHIISLQAMDYIALNPFTDKREVMYEIGRMLGCGFNGDEKGPEENAFDYNSTLMAVLEGLPLAAEILVSAIALFKAAGISGVIALPIAFGTIEYLVSEMSADRNGLDYNELNQLLSQQSHDLFISSTLASPPRDPLIIDLGGDNTINLTTVENGVFFDLDKNGFAEKTAWITGQDGFLVLDRNGNGIIDDGGELFSDQVIMSTNERSVLGGFQALADLDSNGDSVINADDAIFHDLRVWVDSDGITDEGELKTLDELGIVSISLDYTEVDLNDEETDTKITNISYVTFEDDTTAEISEHWFPVNPYDTQEHDSETGLPIVTSISCFGNIPSLHTALQNDQTGELGNLVFQFIGSTNYFEKRVLVKRILYFLTEANDIQTGSRGGNVDARDLHVVEQFMGTEFVGIDGSAIPNSNAATILRNLTTKIENTYFNLLDRFSLTGVFSSMIEENIVTDETGEVVSRQLDLTAVNDYITQASTQGYELDTIVYGLSSLLAQYDDVHQQHNLPSFISFVSNVSEQYSSLLSDISISNIVVGSDEQTQMVGQSGRDIIWSGNTDHQVKAGSGDDIILNSTSNDTIYGGAGNDVYYVGEFHGNDVIYDNEGDNWVVFETGLSLDDYDISVDAHLGFVLTHKKTGETIALPDFLTHPLNYDFISGGISSVVGGGTRTVTDGTDEPEYIKISDGGFNVVNAGDGNDTVEGGTGMDFVYGGEGDDIIDGKGGVNVLFGENGNDKLYDGEDGSYLNGGDGDDELYGGNGSNVLIGGAGNDTIYDGNDGSYLSGGDGDDSLYGGGGADVLDGGAGNDYLQGDHGGDTYVFGKGYDTDTVNASSDDNIIIIHGYSASQMINTRNTHNDLIIHFITADSTDCLIVDHFFDYNSNRNIQFVFDDGTILGQYDITAKYEPIVGTDADEWLGLQGTEGGIIHAGAGNDGVSGNSGNDELYGEAGNDTLYGNDGNDVLDGGTGNDQLNGGNGDDTYIFAKGYEQDTINEWGSDHSIVILADINSDEITVSNQWGSNLLISVIGTDDVLTISNFKWGQSTFTLKFADGAEGYVDKDTWQLVLTKQPDVIEDSEQMSAEFLSSLYEDDALMSNLLTVDSPVISNVTEVTALDDESDAFSDLTDIQAILLAENMSAFGTSDQISDNMNIADITADSQISDTFLADSLQ